MCFHFAARDPAEDGFLRRVEMPGVVVAHRAERVAIFRDRARCAAANCRSRAQQASRVQQAEIVAELVGDHEQVGRVVGPRTREANIGQAGPAASRHIVEYVQDGAVTRDVVPARNRRVFRGRANSCEIGAGRRGDIRQQEAAAAVIRDDPAQQLLSVGNFVVVRLDVVRRRGAEDCAIERRGSERIGAISPGRGCVGRKFDRNDEVVRGDRCRADHCSANPAGRRHCLDGDLVGNDRAAGCRIAVHDDLHPGPQLTGEKWHDNFGGAATCIDHLVVELACSRGEIVGMGDHESAFNLDGGRWRCRRDLFAVTERIHAIDGECDSGSTSGDANLRANAECLNGITAQCNRTAVALPQQGIPMNRVIDPVDDHQLYYGSRQRYFDSVGIAGGRRTGSDAIADVMCADRQGKRQSGKCGEDNEPQVTGQHGESLRSNRSEAFDNIPAFYANVMGVV